MATRKKPKVHEYYHKDGSLYGRGELTAGVMTGYWEWFRKDGSVMRSGSFDYGVQVGEWNTYDRRGRVVKSTIIKPAAGRSARAGRRAGGAS